MRDLMLVKVLYMCVCVCVLWGSAFFKSYSSQHLHVVVPGQLFPLWFSWLKLT